MESNEFRKYILFCLEDKVAISQSIFEGYVWIWWSVIGYHWASSSLYPEENIIVKGW
jgi:hypothetical protein